MKTSKRSLIVAIAVLCICAMSLTTASYAWFSASQTATADNINLTVAKASDLRISLTAPTLDNITNDDVWTSSIDLSAFTLNGAVSTKDATNFYTVADLDGVDAATGTYSGSYTTNGAASQVYAVTVYFRTNAAGAVNVASGEFTKHDDATMNNTKILDGMRMATGATGNVFSNIARTSDVVTGETTTESFTSTPFATGAAATGNVALLEGSDYYTASTTLYFYVEGTDAVAINANTGLQVGGQVGFSFVAAA